MAMLSWLRRRSGLAWAWLRRARPVGHGRGEPTPRQLAEAVAQVHDAIVITDLERCIVWVNDAFERLTGYRLDEVRGRRPGELLQCESTDPAAVQAMREALAARRTVAVELLNRHRDGHHYWVRLRVQPSYDEQGAVQGFMAVMVDVSARRASQAQRRADRELLDRTGRIGGVGGWALDVASGQLRLTDQACRILGLPDGFLPTLADCLSLCRASARVALEQAIAEGVDGRQGWDLDLPLLTHDGRDIWVRVVAAVETSADGAVGVAGALQDITTQHLLRAEIHRRGELLRAAIEALDESFVLYDPADRLVLCNETFRRVHATSVDLLAPGARFEDILRESVHRGLYPEAAGQEEDWLRRRLAARREGNASPRVQRLDNGRILRSVERLLPDGHRVGFEVDITELVHATEEAAAADRAKGEFIATISHELRTPLQSILGFSDLGRVFARGHAQYEGMFEDIHAGGQRMLRLVNGLLDVSKIDGTQASLQRRPHDLGALAEDVLRELSPLAAARQLTLARPGPWPALPVQVDAFRIQQVIRNLLANAIRFAPVGSVVETTGADLGPHGVELSVRDRGPGIPLEEAERVFDAFAQSSRTRDGSGGTGLGLTISRKIVRAHGGRIEALQPADGPGALLRLLLPPGAGVAAVVDDPSAESPAGHASASAAHAPAERPRAGVELA